MDYAPTPDTQPQEDAPKKRGKVIAVIAITLVLLVGGVFAGHFLGLYSLPFLTDTVNTVKVLEVKGTVEVVRPPDILAAREGMRLQNLDTVRTESDSSAWLSLDDYKAVELSELTSLRLDKQAQGFVLTLVYGEIKTRIDQPLYADEEFSVKAGSLALSVRGTVFMVNYTDNIVKVEVESGEVAVLDARGNEIEVLGAGESGEYEAEAGESVIGDTSSTEPTPTTIPAPTINSEAGDIVGFGGYEWRVLEVRDGKVLLLSEYVLEYKPYHVGESREDMDYEELLVVLDKTTWANCDLRAYLNGDFYNSFSESDRARIAETHNVNQDNQWYFVEITASDATDDLGNLHSSYPPRGGADTIDKIFLLSIEEVVRYFGDSGQLANRPYDYESAISDEYDDARKAADRERGFIENINRNTGGTVVPPMYYEQDTGRPTATPYGNASPTPDREPEAYSDTGTPPPREYIGSSWWLRSPGRTCFQAAYVSEYGLVDLSGADIMVDYHDCGLRPALWLNLD